MTAPDFTVSLSPMMIRTFNVTVDFSRDANLPYNIYDKML